MLCVINSSYVWDLLKTFAAIFIKANLIHYFKLS